MYTIVQFIQQEYNNKPTISVEAIETDKINEYTTNLLVQMAGVGYTTIKNTANIYSSTKGEGESIERIIVMFLPLELIHVDVNRELIHPNLQWNEHLVSNEEEWKSSSEKDTEIELQDSNESPQVSQPAWQDATE